MGRCRECRFYDGTGCPARGKQNGGSSELSCFVASNETPKDKRCRSCKFFDGLYCKSKGEKVNGGNSSLHCFVPFA